MNDAKETPDISIILVNYKTASLCIDAVRSVMEKTEGVSYEVIVVDNASPDDSAERLKKELPKEVRLIKSDTNLGFGKANNLGMEAAKGGYYFLLNTDILLLNNAIKILYDFMEANPDVGVAGGNLYDADVKPAHSFLKKFPSVKDYSVFLSVIRKLFRRSKKLPDFNYSDKPMQVAYITGADMMVRRAAIEQAGNFDKDFFMYYEETELSHRIQKAGYQIFSVPDARIIHLEGASFGSGIKEMFNENREHMFAESAMLYYQKVYGMKSVKKYWKARKRRAFFIRLAKAFLRRDKDVLNRRMKILDEEYGKWRSKVRSTGQR